MNDHWIDADDERPSVAGWYPALAIYDPSEGVIPTGAYWNGEVWNPAAAAWFLPTPCSSENEAANAAFKAEEKPAAS